MALVLVKKLKLVYRKQTYQSITNYASEAYRVQIHRQNRRLRKDVFKAQPALERGRGSDTNVKQMFIFSDIVLKWGMGILWNSLLNVAWVYYGIAS